MENAQLAVAFVWHMHQPFYKDTVTGTYLMPWVRLHGIKDYFPMAALIDRCDRTRATFNLVPVLIEQLNDYVHHGARDLFLDLTIAKASDLTLEDKTRILENFFRVNFNRFIEPHPRYAELLIKRGPTAATPAALRKAARSFTTRDLLDLQVLFNLAWFHSITIDEDSNLKEIVEKREGYTESDKAYVIAKQKDVLAQIIPLYRRLQEAGRIEITTTPYFHPIMPLLCDTDVARSSAPSMKLPRPHFAHPEDARWHVQEAIHYHTEQFGRPPRGMWPSEGSVSDEVLDILISSGISWIAADEDILWRTLLLHDKRYREGGVPFDRRIIYQPYRFKRDKRNLSVIFRDKNLSNMISFTYNSWKPQDAATDLYGHLTAIQDNLRRDGDRGLAAIVMDGENAWEYYQDNGRAFFETIYGLLERGDGPATTTVSDYLKLEPSRKALTSIFPASWINQNFEVWIGQEQDNRSWDYLRKVRADLVKITRELHTKDAAAGEHLQKAWREFYIAEGSDWNWWYGGKLGSHSDNPFDPLYRTHLQNIYTLLKKPVPSFLKIPIA